MLERIGLLASKLLRWCRKRDAELSSENVCVKDRSLSFTPYYHEKYVCGDLSGRWHERPWTAPSEHAAVTAERWAIVAEGGAVVAVSGKPDQLLVIPLAKGDEVIPKFKL